MTEWQIVGILTYFLIGLFLADTFLVKVDNFYWFTLLLWPLILVAAIVAFILLFIISLFIPKDMEI